MNISQIHNCFGCGVCAVVCSRQIIKIRLNNDGFYEPHINDISKCTDCSLCVEVCSYSHEDLSLKERCMNSYGAWSKDESVRSKCSSGGVGFELGRTLISYGYKFCGVRYNTELNRAEHYVASTEEELMPSIGSKYIQSYTVDGFKEIDRKQKYLVTGTPCQIDSFRRYIQKFKKEDNFVLMDFFCHGVPSKLMWDKYVKWAEAKVGRLTYVSWRNKFTGWNDSYAMSMEGEKSHLDSRLSQGDMFYRLFLSDACLGKACYDKCRFKYDKSSADIRIGDAWGGHYKEDEKGVSVAVAFTEKGNELLQRCNCELEAFKFEEVAEGQMKKCPQVSKLHIAIMEALKNSSGDILSICLLLYNYKRRQRNIQRIKHPFKTIKNIIEKILS